MMLEYRSVSGVINLSIASANFECHFFFQSLVEDTAKDTEDIFSFTYIWNISSPGKGQGLKGTPLIHKKMVHLI